MNRCHHDSDRVTAIRRLNVSDRSRKHHEEYRKQPRCWLARRSGGQPSLISILGILGFRICGAVGAGVVIVASEASRGPARAFPTPPAAPRAGARLVRPGAAASASFGPSLRAQHYLPSSPLTLATGRKRMDVATYGLFCVGCHIHGLIKGRCQAERARESIAGAPDRTSHSRGCGTRTH
jgi:hypothetical protein